MRRGLIVMLASCLALTGSVAASAGTSMEKVVGGGGTQYWPSSNGTFVAYSNYFRRDYNALAMNEATGHRVRANARGTSGVLGSFIQGTSQFIFQQYGDRSDLYFFDVSNRQRTKAPSAVNGIGWVYWPAGSQEHILYMRATHRFHTRSLMLFDRSTKTNRKLIDDIGGKTVFPGYVGARYAAWTTCGSEACFVFVYDTTTQTTTKLPTPASKSSYAPVIDEATDQIYFVRSADRCGVDVTIRVGALGSDQSTTVATLPRGIDTGWTLSLTSNATSGFQDLYFERWECKDQRGDVWAIRSVDDPGTMRGQDVGPAAAGPYGHPVERTMPTAGAERRPG